MRWLSLLAMAAVVAVLPGQASADVRPVSDGGSHPTDEAPPPPPPPPNYAEGDAWACRPYREDACAADLSYSVPRRRRVLEVQMDRPYEPVVDCFYVYPTVSHAPGANAPIELTEDERRAVALQFARFERVCRPYAPLYRQATVTALTRTIAGDGAVQPAAEATAEADVRAAWRHYLEHDNQGRGFILIGHGQGADILRDLIREDIEGKPVADRLVSAVLPGSLVTAPSGADVGGVFRTTPACRSAEQLGCIIAFNSFRKAMPPGQTYTAAVPAGQRALCTNPAALAGGAAALRSFVATDSESVIPEFTQPPEKPRKTVAPFVHLVGYFRAECVSDGYGSWMAVEPVDDDAAELLYGDFVVEGQRDPGRGLGLVDMELVMGDLINVLQQQANAYAAQAGPTKASSPALPGG